MSRIRVAFTWVALATISLSALGQTEPPVTQPKPAEPLKLTAGQKEEILEEVDKVIEDRVFVMGVDFEKWPEYRDKHKEAIEKAESERQFTSAVNRAFREFGISHMNMRTPSQARARRGLPNPEPKPTDPNLDSTRSPEAFGWNWIEARLGWQQSPSQTEPTSKLTWVNPKVAVLRVFSFTRGYDKKQIQGLMEEAKKSDTLVLDLRSNGGGSTDNLRHLLSMFMPVDTEIGAFINRRDYTEFAESNKDAVEDLTTDEAKVKSMVKIAQSKRRRYRTVKTPVEHYPGKMAVLINRGSASASEICAAALREQRGAVLVGARTAGAVLASVYGRLPHGFEIQYPISDYITHKGVRLEDNPITPDIEANTRASESKDEALDKAIEAAAPFKKS